MKRFQLRPFLLSILVLLLLVACGGETTPPEEASTSEPQPAATSEPESTDIPEPTDTPEPQPTDTPAPTATAVDTNKVSSLEDVRKAVVQIVAEGTFMDPDEGLQLNEAGSGSGFIIDPSGIAVTNNHVVTGAAILRVYIDGEDSPRNAKILGVSECSDLAVIDIDGDDFSYLEWYEDPISVGLDVYTAGFPLGDPEYTLTRGIVSKERADGETSWASVDSVLEHDATINPGNSGGPLVDADGKIVGVNYARSANNQYFAIAREEAIPVIEKLVEGEDVTSIGINGFALFGDEGGIGIWVSSISSGSPADETGLKPGDIITSLEGLSMAQDGTLSDYCDVLRSREPDDTMSIKVVRIGAEDIQVLEGQLNGKELEFTTSFGNVVDTAPSEDVTYSYTTIQDDSGSIAVEIPTVWSDIDSSVPDSDSFFYAQINASTDLAAVNSGWTVPGIYFGVSNDLSLSENDILDVFIEDYSSSCDYGGRSDYQDVLYTGVYDIYTECSEEGTGLIMVAVTPEERNFVILVQVQVITDADLDALEHILDSFVVFTGEGSGNGADTASNSGGTTTNTGTGNGFITAAGENSSATCRIEFWGPAEFHLDVGNGTTDSREVPPGEYGWSGFLGDRRTDNSSIELLAGGSCDFVCGEEVITYGCT